MKAKFIIVYCWLIRILLFFLPDIPLFMRLRGFLYGIFMIHCGKDFQVTHDAIIKELNHIKVVQHCFVGNGVVIMGSGTIEIGNYVMIAPHSVIISGNHTSLYGAYKNGPIDIGQVIIKSGSWIAANCTVVKGAVLPEDSVLCANSFLNKSYSTAHSVYGGIPAKLIKTRTDA